MLTELRKNATAIAAGAAILLAGMFFSATKTHADDTAQDEVQIGLNIAPVPLNMIGKDPKLVGLGSFLVNAVGDCNGCHTASPSGTEYTDAGNPYLLPFPKGPYQGTTQVDPKYYLAGGQDFGPLCPGVGGTVPGCAPDLITRNLTPDFTGNPEGGHSLSDFLNIIQNGADYDHIHPICGEKINGVTRTNYCVSAPPAGNTNGDVLQVMPWPVFRNMSTYQLTAIWTYLSAIPCINNTWSLGPLADPNELQNKCH